MPSPVQRDPGETAATLTKWLRGQFPEASDITITKLHAPPSSGFSGETILLETVLDGVDRPLVIRVAPSTYDVFLEPDFEAQWKVMKALAKHTDVPMPPMLAYEAGTAWLGSPFFLMGRVVGEAAADAPPYTETGWIKDATPEQQAQLYDSGLRAMTGVHNADWQKLDLGFLQRDEFDYVERYYVWAGTDDPMENPAMEAALEWVRANRPALPADLALCWGDARPGNLLFRDFEVQAVVDWEMATIADPLLDLGWWLFLERFHTDGSGFPPIPGFPGADAAVRRWEELTGRTADRDVLHFYKVFAGVRFGCVMMRLATLFKKFGLLPPDADMARNNPVLTVVRMELGL